MDVPVTTHAGVYGITLDAACGACTRTASAPQHGSTCTPRRRPQLLRMIAASGGSCRCAERVSAARDPPTWKLRQYGIPVSLSQDTASGGAAIIFSAMRATLSADRVMDDFENHNEGKAVTDHHLRAEQVVDWATGAGPRRSAWTLRWAAWRKARRPTWC